MQETGAILFTRFFAADTSDSGRSVSTGVI